MLPAKSRPAIWSLAIPLLCVGLSLYFTFAAVQGDYGVFQRADMQAKAKVLRDEYESLSQEVARLENLRRRMSDDYLDLDLLEEQARSVLGLVRADELVIQ